MTSKESSDRATVFMSRVVPTLMTIQTAILLAGVPWALSVHGRLIRLEVTMAQMKPAAVFATDDDLDDMRERVVRLEVKHENERNVEP